MAKLIMAVLALTFTALVALASARSPIEKGSSQQCRQQLQGQRFNQCQSYIRNNSRGKQNGFCCVPPKHCWPCTIITEGEQVLGQIPMGLEECCNELQMVEEECQCEAMQEVYKQAQQQQWSQQGGRQQQQTQDLPQIVQNLRNQCNLQVQQCRIPYATMF